jgi:hypothetical protein
MFPLKTRKIDSKYLKRYSIILATVWTCVVIAILTWNLKQNDEDNLENAYLYTKVGFEKDILYRRWATLHGGIYVPITEKTQPNPYLIEIPERDIQTPSGKKLTLMNPAYMTRQVYEIESEISKARSHLTSLNPIRHKNKPDAWEKKLSKLLREG